MIGQCVIDRNSLLLRPKTPPTDSILLTSKQNDFRDAGSNEYIAYYKKKISTLSKVSRLIKFAR